MRWMTTKIGAMLFASMMVLFCCAMVFGSGTRVMSNHNTHDPNFTGSARIKGKHLIAGHPDDGSALRKVQFQIRDGSVPGTNLDIIKYTGSGVDYNGPVYTGAVNMAGNTSSGSFALSVSQLVLTFDITEEIEVVLAADIVMENLVGTEEFHIFPKVVDNNMTLEIYESGTLSPVDWTVVTNGVGKVIQIDINFLTRQ